ncbi:MAG: MFS transporter [Gammaproteobacteria bacterium]|nr:MFS transporter [Gammaproteobacteria bacterium]
MTKVSNQGVFQRRFLPWLMFAMGASYYCLTYFLRVSPSVMKKDLLTHFKITATEFGSLSSAYYNAYTPMQLFVGVIVDRLGARKVLVSACLICMVGLSIFIHAETLQLAKTGRFLIGFGSAFAYITVLKLVALWLPPNRFATAAGLTSAFGMSAGIFSQIYLASFVEKVGYKSALSTGLTAGLILSVILFLVVRDRPKAQRAEAKLPGNQLTLAQTLRGLGYVLMKKETWVIGFVGLLLYLPASAFLDLWGIPYLETAYHVTSEKAAMMIFFVYFGWILAGPLIGALSDKIRLRCLPLLVTSIFSTIFSAMAFYIPNLPFPLLYTLLFLFGVTCGSHPLVFSLSREKNPEQISGTATATTNFFIMLGGVLFQPFMGKILDWHWSGALIDGVRVYTLSDYKFALAVVPIGLFLSCILILFIKETHCKIQEQPLL